MHRIVVIGLLVLGVMLATSRTAHAAPPAWAAKAVVEVDAYEHYSLGVAVEGGWRVLVPYETIEVNHPGAIGVTAATGRVKAWVVATDKAAGLALLALERPIAVALAPSPSHLSSPNLFAIDTTSTLEKLTWQPYPLEYVAPGSPIIDDEGRLVGLERRTSGAMARSKGAVVAGPSIARMTAPAPERARRNVIPYGGGGMQLEFSKGGVWWGMDWNLAARWHDLIEARADASVTFLLPSAKHEECGEPPCFAGVRGVLTPQIGPHFSLGTGDPVGITPSIGLALGAQIAYRGDGAPTSDVRAPNTWLMPAVGVSLTLGLGEIRARARLPYGAMDVPSFELGVGLAF